VHYNLGIALTAQGNHAGAEAAYRRAVDRKPDYAEARLSLGGALLLQQKYAAAEAALRKALDLKPDFALAWYHLGYAVMEQARFDEAATALKKAGELFPAKHPGGEQARQLLQQCQRYGALDARLPAILKGTAKPANAGELLEFAQLCKLKQLCASAAGLYAAAFATKPEWAEEVRTGVRYQAACAAALAGCGRGEDAAQLDGAERGRWRSQALDWLRADLAAWVRWLDGDVAARRGAVQQALTHWRENPDLACVREPVELKKLAADERKEYLALWAEVDALLARSRK
jgi:serine/threonine-protein kinase